MGRFDAWGFFFCRGRSASKKHRSLVRRATCVIWFGWRTAAWTSPNGKAIDASVGHPEVNPADVVAGSQFLARTFQNDASRFHQVRRPRDLERIVGGLGC